MSNMELLKRRIETAEDLQSVVRTMKAMAAVSIRQFEAATESLLEYTRTVELAASMLLFDNPRLEIARSQPRGTRHGWIVFGSDQGMCGVFNERIASFVKDHWADSHRTGDTTAGGKEECRLLCLGVRAADKLMESQLPVDHVLECAGSVRGITSLVQELLPLLDRWRRSHHLNRIELVYNARDQASSYRTRRVRLLPFDAQRLQHLRPTRWPGRSLPLVTLDTDRMLSALIQQYLFIELYRASAESAATENASRIASLRAAEQNIEERIMDYRSEFQQLRQTSITEELLDVVTGFEALMSQPSRVQHRKPEHSTVTAQSTEHPAINGGAVATGGQNDRRDDRGQDKLRQQAPGQEERR